MTNETADKVGEIAKAGLELGAVAAPFVPNPVAQAAIVLAAKYGPQVIDQIEAALAKDQVSLDEIRAIFTTVKPYDAYEIPEAPPATLVNVAEASAPPTP